MSIHADIVVSLARWLVPGGPVLALVAAMGLNHAAGAGCPPGSVVVQPISQNRTLSTTASAARPVPPPPIFDSDEDSDAAEGFGLFDSEVSASASIGFAGGSATASQLSELDCATISAIGNVQASAVSVSLGASSSANGSSSFSMTFELDEAVTATLSVELAASTPDPGPPLFVSGASMALLGPTGTIVSTSQGSLTKTIDLLPGEYTLNASASAEANGNAFLKGPPPFWPDASYDVSLVFEAVCAADQDGDGLIGFADLTLLLNAWGPCVSCPEDLDMSGSVGFNDLTLLLGSWGLCP